MTSIRYINYVNICAITENNLITDSIFNTFQVCLFQGLLIIIIESLLSTNDTKK